MTPAVIARGVMAWPGEGFAFFAGGQIVCTSYQPVDRADEARAVAEARERLGAPLPDQERNVSWRWRSGGAVVLVVYKALAEAKAGEATDLEEDGQGFEAAEG